MKKVHRLDLDSLNVESFATTDPSQSIEDPYAVIKLPTTDPTAQTFCFYCPPETFDTCI